MYSPGLGAEKSYVLDTTTVLIHDGLIFKSVLTILFANIVSGLARINDDDIVKFSRFLMGPFLFDPLEVRRDISTAGSTNSEFLGPMTGGEDSRRVPDESYRFPAVIGDLQLELEVF